MESNFTNENFERFLRRNADDVRMTPSEKVWKAISLSLNRGKRGYTVALASVLLLASLFGYFIIEESNNDIAAAIVKKETGNNNNSNPPVATSLKENTSALPRIENVNIKNPVSFSSVSLFKSERRALSSLLLNTERENIVTNQNIFYGTIIDSDIHPDQQVTSAISSAANRNELPLTIESVLNSYKARKKSKVGLQLYFTPTVSYRKLTENKPYLQSAAGNFPGNYPLLQDVNDSVTHKPDMGFELGLASKYALSKNFKLLAGVQFNVSRYGIKSFKSSLQVATIQLNGSAPVTDITNQNNESGYSSNWLQNFYVQVSAPVGIEYKVIGNEKVQFGVATTIQPTYVLGDRAYLISADYKNYLEVPWLSRKWNVATSIETFVSYSTGNLKWQVGPQFRYQVLSSFISKYPVKENLFDYGLKVGVSLNNQ